MTSLKVGTLMNERLCVSRNTTELKLVTWPTVSLQYDTQSPPDSHKNRSEQEHLLVMSKSCHLGWDFILWEVVELCCHCSILTLQFHGFSFLTSNFSRKCIYQNCFSNQLELPSLKVGQVHTVVSAGTGSFQWYVLEHCVAWIMLYAINLSTVARLNARYE